MDDAGRNYFLRVDEAGKSLQRELQSPAETVVLVPKGLSSLPLTSPLGFSAPAIVIAMRTTFNFDMATYASGIGKPASSSTITTGSNGSNGGFANGDALVEAQIAGKLYRPFATARAVKLN